MCHVLQDPPSRDHLQILKFIKLTRNSYQGKVNLLAEGIPSCADRDVQLASHIGPVILISKVQNSRGNPFGLENIEEQKA